MPTEHEYKFVLSPTVCKHFWEWHALSECHSMIDQGYFAGRTTRLRKIRNLKGDYLNHWILTFKQKVESRTVEIEVNVDDRDGNDLWPVCEGKLKKDRLTFVDSGARWEVDFFWDQRYELYFSLAEVELPEGAERPKVPEFLKPFVLHEVALTDDRFSNKKLGDVEFARELYKQIKQGVFDEKQSEEGV